MKYKGKCRKWKVNRQETTRTWAHRQRRKRRRGRKSENTNYPTETEVERIWTGGENGGPRSPAGGPCSPDTSQVEAAHLDVRESGEMPVPSHAPSPRASPSHAHRRRSQNRADGTRTAREACTPCLFLLLAPNSHSPSPRPRLSQRKGERVGPQHTASAPRGIGVFHVLSRTQQP